MKFEKTVPYVDLKKFMKPWYVIAGRTTILESGAHNAVEKYTWNETEKRIDVDFSFNKDSFSGKKRSIPQKAWVVDPVTNAHWKVQPIWPLKFDYLVIALAKDYEWTAIGVPSGRYLWIMSEKPSLTSATVAEIINHLKEMGYPVHDIDRVPQKASRKLNAKNSPGMTQTKPNDWEVTR